MLWHAMPPELNTARLMAGAGPEPMLQAAAAWEGLALILETHAIELGAALVSLKGMWTGMGSDRATLAATPMVSWLHTAANYAHRCAQQSASQAMSYMKALGTTPSLPEIAVNHITHGVLTATNFLGINLVPIAFNETDYFVRMWNQAGGAMDIYQAETAANTTFEPLPAPQPILAPGMDDAVKALVTVKLAEMAAEGPAKPWAEFSMMPGDMILTPPAPPPPAPTLSDFTELAGDEPPPTPTPTPAPEPTDTTPFQQLVDFFEQPGSISGVTEQLLQPVQQATSLFSQTSSMGSGADIADSQDAQMGLLGTNPLSNHPLAGGSGPSMGAGLLRAQSVPGAARSSPRTPLMAQLIEGTAVQPAAATSSTRSITASAGSSAMGGAAPMGMMGTGAQAANSPRSGLATPGMLTHNPDETDHEDLDDQDDW